MAANILWIAVIMALLVMENCIPGLGSKEAFASTREWWIWEGGEGGKLLLVLLPHLPSSCQISGQLCQQSLVLVVV